MNSRDVLAKALNFHKVALLFQQLFECDLDTVEGKKTYVEIRNQILEFIK